ncbi:MAG: helix-turn-helix transcriptional regulator [Nitriliruptor sp.]|uniref:helix-turn-helix domain-containing protein n=1 Tax=Nitriliruptor sp. TaxID=2448056 RepID=UPI0034A0780D
MEPRILTRQARARAGLTLRDLAAQAGTSSATLSAYETGAKDPRASTLLRVLTAAGTELRPVGVRPAGQRFVDLLCERIAELVVADPALLDRAREVLPRLEGRSSWAGTWATLLDAGPVVVVAVLTSTSPEASALKTDSPFALLDLISGEERLRLLEQTHAS